MIQTPEGHDKDELRDLQNRLDAKIRVRPSSFTTPKDFTLS